MKNLILITLFQCFLISSTFANENFEGIKVENGKLIIDLNSNKIEDILLQDGTVIDSHQLKKLEKQLKLKEILLKAKSGSDGGGG